MTASMNAVCGAANTLASRGGVWRILALASILLVAISSPTLAAVSNAPDVNGLRTFQDLSTGRIWLDLDNFFDVTATVGTTGNDMIATAQANGFAFASRADVEQLLGSLPLDAGQWSGYASAMGSGQPRQLIWGMYNDGSPELMGWAYAFSNGSAWAFTDNIVDLSIVQNAGGSGASDMGIWAYSVSTVPEPSTYVLALAALAVFGAHRFRRGQRAHR